MRGGSGILLGQFLDLPKDHFLGGVLEPAQQPEAERPQRPLACLSCLVSHSELSSCFPWGLPLLDRGSGGLLGLQHSKATWESSGEGDVASGGRTWCLGLAGGTALLSCSSPFVFSWLRAWCAAASHFVSQCPWRGSPSRVCPALLCFHSRTVACQAPCIPVQCWHCLPPSPRRGLDLGHLARLRTPTRTGIYGHEAGSESETDRPSWVCAGDTAGSLKDCLPSGPCLLLPQLGESPLFVVPAKRDNCLPLLALFILELLCSPYSPISLLATSTLSLASQVIWPGKPWEYVV